MSDATTLTYGGDVPVLDAWAALSADQDATLIDVRTTVEWAFVGVPDLMGIGKAPLFVAWSEYPPEDLAEFSVRMRAELQTADISVDPPLYFLCRSGQRSRSAAIAATEAGYSQCFNVVDGFEGVLDSNGHRATPGSWKAAGLPWRQT
ncbi:MAG: rhodanese-like domain-containing protein [Alphaproteobacteria bacterium]